MKVAAVMRELMAAGVTGDALVDAIERIEASSGDEPSARQERNRRYYEAQRLKASEKRLNGLNSEASETVLKASETVLKSDASRVRDITSTSVDTGKKKETKTLVADLEFEAVYRAYPHFKGRSAKNKSFLAWKALSSEHRGGMLSAVKRYADEGKEPKADCGAKAFELWLKDQRFLDWMDLDHPPPSTLTPVEQAAEEAKWSAYLTRQAERMHTQNA